MTPNQDFDAVVMLMALGEAEIRCSCARLGVFREASRAGRPEIWCADYLEEFPDCERWEVADFASASEAVDHLRKNARFVRHIDGCDGRIP